jgi:cytosine deaminase
MRGSSSAGSSLLAEKCARIATEGAEKAAARGTFGVGGLLIENSTGRVLKKALNRVISENAIDPTAHVEKQLVDWYFSRRKALPPAAGMTIISSLDPCIMCTGAILGAGLGVIHIADDPECGVSCRGHDDLTTLPAELQQQKAASFSTFGLRGKRAFAGPQDSIFSRSEIDPVFEKRSTRAFTSSLGRVRGRINKNWISPDRLENPRLLIKSKPSLHIVKTVRRYNPEAFSEKHTLEQDAPGAALGRVLIEKAEESYRNTGSLFNSACIIDPFGNILLSAGGANSVEQTPLLDVMRRYYLLASNVGKDGRRYLAHPKYCKIAILFGPASDPTGFMEIGALGSFFEGKLAKHGQLEYVLPRQDASELANTLRNLPPFYSKTINLENAIRQTRDGALVEFCRKAVAKRNRM